MHAESLQILVGDKDLRPGMPPAIYQYILTGFGAEKFAVDQRGYLYLNSGPLDADNNSSTYQLHVQAKEVDTEPARSSEPITLRIHVIDVNDNAPTFELPVYVLAVAANGDTERVVARLAANDLDSGKFSKLHYKIIDVSDGATTSFRYDEQTNELKAVGALKPGHRYQVVLEAEDGGGRSGRTVALVFASPDASHSEDELQSSGSIESTHSTPLLPIVPFTPGTTRRLPSTGKTEPSEPLQTMVTELSEATPPNSVVAILGDEDTKSKVFFRIVDGNSEGKFAIDEASGTLTTTQGFDREKTDVYTLQIEARSRQPDQALYWTILQISVTDANDHAPEFLDPQPIGLRLKIDDAAQIRSNVKVGSIRIRDLDKEDNGRVTLRILPPQSR
ncbi:CRE-CDH-5 protein [Aphelenchoides avenae]|nr:CRE-CDH-5 protein [Aphelenchus avenae]